MKPLPIREFRPESPDHAAGRDPSDILVGVSSCLLGAEVRFDGGHQKNSFLVDEVAEWVRFVPVCPEIEIGLGAPRETLRLLKGKSETEPRLVAPKSGTDLTERMRDYSEQRVARLKKMNLSGYVLKRRSPTCGMERVKQYDDHGVPQGHGRGVFAEVLMREMPLLPVEEEGRLQDPGLRDHFFVRVFAHHRVMRFFSEDWTVGDLVDFHSREKLLLMAHDPEGYRELGRMVGQAKGADRDGLARRYQERFFRALQKPATPMRHINVMQHAVGYFRGVLPDAARRSIHATMEDYTESLVPLSVPLTLIRHHVESSGIGYLARQRYLSPHPKELALRNYARPRSSRSSSSQPR
ncbi:MAG: DUF1722 domain-containing protein [Gemmatimonadetes bacterium]|nr:DUF1722 domain-containing protein [Gemmatimonadota bacterium]